MKGQEDNKPKASREARQKLIRRAVHADSVPALYEQAAREGWLPEFLREYDAIEYGAWKKKHPYRRARSIQDVQRSELLLEINAKNIIRPVRGKGGRRRVPREKSKAYHWANEVKKVLPKFREGYKLLRKFKAAYPAQKAVWERELSGRQYLPLHIGALIESKTIGAAACRYVANRDGLKLRSVQNAYSRFK